jgi:hypothetical protein
MDEIKERFFNTPRPQEQESLSGYLIRLCSVNYYKIGWLYRELGVKKDSEGYFNEKT